VGLGLWRWFRPTFTVTEVVAGPVVQAFYSTGTIAPEREFPIKANIEGILTEVHVDKGDAVKQGQVLAVVFDGGLQFMFDKAQAELTEKQKLADPKTSPVLMEFDSRLEATNELLAIAEREQKRVTTIVASGGANQTDLDQAIDRFQRLWSEAESIKAQKAARLLELQREVKVAQSALNIAKWNVDEQTLESPIDGVVLDRPASRGTRLAINGHVMNIADVRPENLVMRAAVDEEDIAGVNEGQAVKMTLYAFPNRTFTGRVRKIYDQADESRRTFEVDVELDAQGERLSPGMTGELAFILAEKEKAHVIPSQAVQGDSVWVVRNHQLVRLTPELGIRSVERTEVLSGLAPGDQIVIDPVAGFKEGQTVATTFINPADAAGLNKKEVEEQPFKAFD
jgi:HlyD family secretion protein